MLRYNQTMQIFKQMIQNPSRVRILLDNFFRTIFGDTLASGKEA